MPIFMKRKMRRWPVGMLFVRCRQGISHHPDESVRLEDVADALRAYFDAAAALANSGGERIDDIK